MVRKAIQDNDWHNVTDAKERKRIQDRLAQRARRRRLREAAESGNAKQASQGRETQRLGAVPYVETPNGRQIQPQNTPNQVALSSSRAGAGSQIVPATNANAMGLFFPLSTPDISDASDEWIEEQEQLPESAVAMLHHVPEWCEASPSSQPFFKLNVYSALYINGILLGLSCSVVKISKSAPVDISVPPALRPTDLQLTTDHPLWIDRLPFPKMRNSMITMKGVLDEEDLLKDFFLGPSFEMVTGRAPWDPRAYKLERGFGEKWGWLFI